MEEMIWLIVKNEFLFNLELLVHRLKLKVIDLHLVSVVFGLELDCGSLIWFTQIDLYFSYFYKFLYYPHVGVGLLLILVFPSIFPSPSKCYPFRLMEEFGVEF